MKMSTLPTWKSISKKVAQERELNLLETFIYDEEPIGMARKWRQALHDAILSYIEDY